LRYVAIALVAVAVMRPAIAWAHARLTRSDPAANSRLASSPTAIRLWFSEAPELAMTHLTLEDSAGKLADVGPVERAESKLAIEAKLRTPLAPGRYVLSWRTAAADGHPSQGRFRFVVLSSAATRATASAVSAPPVTVPETTSQSMNVNEPTALTPAYVAARALSFAAILIVIGAAVFRVAVVARAAGLDNSLRTSMSAKAARLGFVAAVVTLVAAVVRLYLQSRMMNGSAAAEMAPLRVMTTETQWGVAWLIQAAAAVCAIVAFWLARRGSKLGWAVAGVAAAALAASPALGGHAIASARLTTVAVLVDGLHVLGAAGWLGSLLCVVFIGVRVALEDAGETRWQTVAAVVNAFSPTALAFATVVALTGLVSAWLRLGSLAPLWTSTYGRVLLVKLALLSGVVATAAYNWLRVRPSLGTESATRHFRRSAATELAIGVLVIVATAILVAVPTPIAVR
jgi:putative copper export protein/methionine-rich copper-binding protein CopC